MNLKLTIQQHDDSVNQLFNLFFLLLLFAVDSLHSICHMNSDARRSTMVSSEAIGYRKLFIMFCFVIVSWIVLSTIPYTIDTHTKYMLFLFVSHWWWYLSDLTFYFSDLLICSLEFLFHLIPQIVLKSERINRTVRQNKTRNETRRRRKKKHNVFLSCTSIRSLLWRWNKLK